jgi:hypothetical protein
MWLVKRWVAVFSLLAVVAAAGCASSDDDDTTPRAGSPSASGEAGLREAPNAGGNQSAEGGAGGSASQALGGGVGANVNAGAGAASVDETPLGDVTTEADCVELAKALCRKHEECAEYPFRSDYGDRGTCEARHEAFCVAGLKIGALDGKLCWRALTAPGCQGFPGAEVPPVCLRPLGAGEVGAVCGSRSDCASGYCARKGECGTCAAPAVAGEVCASTEECQQGLVCGQGRCQEALDLGAECPGEVCGLHASCVDGLCKSLGRAGDECGPMQPCDSASGYVCAAGVCAALELVGQGESCGVSGTQPRCSDGLACLAEVALGARSCVTQPDLGEPCPDGRCRAPLLCVDGTCGVVEPSFCE